MIYLFYGIEDFIIKKKIDLILKNSKFNKDYVKKFNGLNHLLSDALEAFLTQDLFNKNNFVIFEDFDKFLSSKIKNKKEQIDSLAKASIDFPKSTMILISNGEKLKNKELFDEMTSLIKIEECNKLAMAEIRKLVFKAFENRGLSVHPSTVEYLLKRSGKNVRGLISEIDKLSLLEKNITKDLIKKVVVKKPQNNIFLLIDSIVKKDKQKAINLFYDLTTNGSSIVSIITMLGNEISLLYNLKLARDWKAKNSDLSTAFKKPLFVVSKAAKVAQKYTEKNLKKILDDVLEMEFLIKTGKVSNHLLFELILTKILIK